MYRNFVRKFGVFFIGLTILTLLVTMATGGLAKQRLVAEYPAPGKLVDVGGYNLHINCQGEGDHTVLFEAGAGNFSLHWSLVQAEVAQFTKACVYDRAGYGWSDRSPKERTQLVMAEELHQLLEKEGINGPYILVGHSLGRLIARIYAHQYPNEVVEIVLVDATHEDAPLRSPKALQKVDVLFRQRLHQRMRWLILKNQLGLQALSPQSISPPTQFSEDTQQTYRALLASRPGYYMTFPEELEGLERSLPQIRDMRLNTLGDMPLVVLVAGEDQEPNPSIGLTVQVIQQQAQSWFEMQNELAALSSRSQLMIAQNSNHMIPLQQPEMVIQAIEIVIVPEHLSSKSFKGFE